MLDHYSNYNCLFWITQQAQITKTEQKRKRKRRGKWRWWWWWKSRKEPVNSKIASWSWDVVCREKTSGRAQSDDNFMMIEKWSLLYSEVKKRKRTSLSVQANRRWQKDTQSNTKKKARRIMKLENFGLVVCMFVYVGWACVLLFVGCSSSFTHGCSLAHFLDFGARQEKKTGKCLSNSDTQSKRARRVAQLKRQQFSI